MSRVALHLFLALMVVAVPACGSDPAAPVDETDQLDTRLRRRVDGIWNTHGSTVEALEIEYRFLAATRQGGRTTVAGSYRMLWHNRTRRTLQIDYDLQFVDADGLLVALFDPGDGPELSVSAGGRREATQTFEITVPTVARANEVTIMRIQASFRE